MNLASTVEKAQIKMAWWVEISTARPRCIYYFGPFESMKEAVLAKPGYIEDLLNEGALGIGVEIKRCKPKELTIFFEELSERAGEIPMDANELLRLCSDFYSKV